MRSILWGAVVATILACGDPFGPPAPSRENLVDTLSIYALHSSPVSYPSALALELTLPVVRSDLSTGFDFAFDIDAEGRVVLLSTGALGMGRGSGAQMSTEPFDSVAIAPPQGYEVDSALVLDAGDVVIVHSRPTNCGYNPTASLAWYAKLQVLTVDTTSGADGRRVDFQILVNQNCGYRGLEPGLPSR